MANRRLTFREILAGAEKGNSERLMKKARRANRIAKIKKGHQKQIAYSVKAKALGFLVRKMPDRVCVRRDIILTDFVVIELKNTNQGLHFPVINL